MRELRGVAYLTERSIATLKCQILFVDEVEFICPPRGTSRLPPQLQTDLEFLRNYGFVNLVDHETASNHVEQFATQHERDSGWLAYAKSWLDIEKRKEIIANSATPSANPPLESDFWAPLERLLHDYYVDALVTYTRKEYQVEVVPVWTFLRSGASAFDYFTRGVTKEVLQVALEALPLPGEDSALEDVLSFKEEMREKQWHFRRFLHSLVTKKQTEAETRDDLEWTVNEYTKAMKVHNLKAGNGLIEVYVMPVIELAEDLVKFRWSKIAKGALAVNKREIDLMEAEMKAPGRECAYVFDAQKRFGPR